MSTVRETDHELHVQVVDALAHVTISPVADPDRGVTVSLPARRLLGLLRAAWADDRFGPVGPLDPELWAMTDLELGHQNDPYAEERLRFGWRDEWPDAWDTGEGTVLPFPHRMPWRRPRPPNGGTPWSAEDDAALRTAWLAADPEVARSTTVDDLAERFGRTAGAVTNRLHRVGCDPARPGAAATVPGGVPVGLARDREEAPECRPGVSEDR